MEKAAQVVPPGALGTPPPPPDAPDPFMDALVFRLLGVVPPEDNPDPNVLKAVSGSPGSYTGTARVVRSLAEGMDLEDGEVMVCEMTLPPWVPLFSIAGASCPTSAACSRTAPSWPASSAIPAVVGTQVGTNVIQTGQTITVDGTKASSTSTAAPSEQIAAAPGPQGLRLSDILASSITAGYGPVVTPWGDFGGDRPPGARVGVGHGAWGTTGSAGLHPRCIRGGGRMKRSLLGIAAASVLVVVGHAGRTATVVVGHDGRAGRHRGSGRPTAAATTEAPGHHARRRPRRRAAAGRRTAPQHPEAR